MGKHCPYCGSTRFHWDNLSDDFKCYNCGGHFDESEDDRRDEYECPTCGSTNTAYYNKSGKRHYCYDCETRW